MALTAYLTQVQRLLHDPNATYYSTSDLTAYINIARRQIAIEGQCVRVMLSGGVINSIAVTNPGSGFTSAPTIGISGSGFQAQATASWALSSISTITILNGGWGYTTAPTITISGGGGANAAASAGVDNSCSTVAGQEVYQFSTWNTLAQQTAGVQFVQGVFSIACSQGGTYKPLLTPKTFTEFQAYLRIYQNQAQNYPVYWAQYNFGVNGSVYLFPWPSQVNQMDIDAYCMPIDLVSDSTVEAIPSPWTDAVPYYAAYLSYDNAQRPTDSDRMFKDYTTFMKRARAMSEPPFVPDYYSGD